MLMHVIVSQVTQAAFMTLSGQIHNTVEYHSFIHHATLLEYHDNYIYSSIQLAS